MVDYRLSQAAYLMAGKEPPPDVIEGGRLKPKPLFFEVEQFLKDFMGLFSSGKISHVWDRLHGQELPETLIITTPGGKRARLQTALQVVLWAKHQADSTPAAPLDINFFHPVFVSTDDLRAIAAALGTHPDFLHQAKTDGFHLPVEPGTGWEQIKFKIVNENYIEITTPGRRENFTTAGLGFSRKPMLWAVLKMFADGLGTIPPPDRGSDRVKASISNLRKHLKALFPEIDGPPINSYKPGTGYICRFQIFTLDR